MLGLIFSSPLLFVVWAVAMLLAITVHEFAHALMADRLGDPTPRMQGRLTLNPLAHLDPLGTLMLLLVRFGWGKPVQFDPYNLQNPRRDSAVISLAGPASNLIVATALSVILHFISYPFSPLGGLVNFLEPIIFLNVALAVFNLIPIHPLDGGKIFVGLLPARDALEADRFLHKYGMLILLFLILPLTGEPLVTRITSPVINIILSFLLPGISMV